MLSATSINTKCSESSQLKLLTARRLVTVIYGEVVRTNTNGNNRTERKVRPYYFSEWEIRRQIQEAADTW